MRNMIPSNNCIDIIKKFEGLSLNAYKCPAGIWTIGYGSTMYQNGSRINPNDKITLQQAEDLIKWEVENKSKVVAARLSGLKLNQNQFDALVSFAYNVGLAALEKSTLFRKVKVNPNDATIRAEFMKWVNANGKRLAGLVRRREAEANLYFTV